MNENIKALLEKVTGDESLLAKFSACGSADEAYELAKSIVGGYTKEEFAEAMAALSAANDGDISDEDLSEAAGGVDPALTGFGQISELVKDTASEVADSVSEAATKVADSAVAVSEFISNSEILDVTKKSISKSASAVSNYVEEVSKSVSKSVSKVSKALAV